MSNTYNKVVLWAVSIGSFNYGFSFGAPSTVLALGGFLEYFHVALTPSNKSYASSMQGAIVGVFFAGGFFGSFFFAWLADKIGRKRALDVVGIVSLIAVIISTASVHVGMLLVGRIIQGFAGGGLNVICPMFQSEVSVAEHRGKNVGLHGSMFVTGLAVCNWLALGLYFMTNQQLAWRLVMGLQGVAPLVLLSLRFWLPESPRWLILNNRDEEALAVLEKLHPQHVDHAAEGNLAEKEHALIKGQVLLDKQHDTTWSALFTRRSTRKRLLLGMFLMFMQQSTGQNVLYGFQVNTLVTLGLTKWQPSLVVCMYVSWAATLNYVGGWMMDRFGRRQMILGALCGSTLATSIHTALVIHFGGTTNKAGAGAAVAFLFLFITFFAPGIDVTSYVYGAEIFPTYMRARGMAVTIGAYFAFAATYVCSSSAAGATIGPYYNIIFICLSAMNFVIAWYALPETKGLSLEEMGALFGEGRDEVVHMPLGGEGFGNEVKEDSDVEVRAV